MRHAVSLQWCALLAWPNTNRWFAVCKSCLFFTAVFQHQHHWLPCLMICSTLSKMVLNYFTSASFVCLYVNIVLLMGRVQWLSVQWFEYSEFGCFISVLMLLRSVFVVFFIYSLTGIIMLYFLCNVLFRCITVHIASAENLFFIVLNKLSLMSSLTMPPSPPPTFPLALSLSLPLSSIPISYLLYQSPRYTREGIVQWIVP